MSEELKQEPGFGSSLALLDALGIGPVWVRRELAVEEVQGAAATQETLAPTPAAPVESPNVSAPQPVAAEAKAAVVTHARPSPPLPVAPAPAAAPVEQEGGPPSWLDDMDFGTALEPVLIPDGDEEQDAPSVDPLIARLKTMDWPQLKQQVAGCRRCGLCQGRKNTVFGVGDEKARWLFIGEGPGRNEDQQGEPFVGPAGKLLDNMLLSMGVKRGENAYIANIVKCRPTDDNGRDRPPSPQEVAACLPYLQRQIELIQPTVLVALGKTAAISLLGMDPATPVSRLRGTVHRYQDRPLVVTYHPAYLLRTLTDKSKAWADLCLAMSTYQAQSR
ncbi:uracil-DNA glycosylase [Herbaspirillum sp. GW103]|uniref:uracil-DNA glycosylase n=1 Tax=Herbaspirillum sp. GW103 TaxID=1175306 RepID=UPI00025E47C2|nr:uracil-DNA glycosylase [Herbaspirillum sp. GW103]EIJ47332.1 uracil-DNA glycosylase [Herbaspirillum sp. GW103]